MRRTIVRWAVLLEGCACRHPWLASATTDSTRYVYADISLYRAGQWWIWTWTTFSDPGRADYALQNWLTRIDNVAWSSLKSL
jgi:hypothetical protein